MSASDNLQRVLAPTGTDHALDRRVPGRTLCGKGVLAAWKRIPGRARRPACTVCARIARRRFGLR